METKIEKFRKEREDLNAVVEKYAGKNIKKFYNLDMHVYEDGALPSRTKEMLGLVASLVLRCDDCITYHMARCIEGKVSDAEMEEVMQVGLIVGGSITIPHIRRAIKAWDEEKSRQATSEGLPPAP